MQGNEQSTGRAGAQQRLSTDQVVGAQTLEIFFSFWTGKLWMLSLVGTWTLGAVGSFQAAGASPREQRDDIPRAQAAASPRQEGSP